MLKAQSLAPCLQFVEPVTLPQMVQRTKPGSVRSKDCAISNMSKTPLLSVTRPMNMTRKGPLLMREGGGGIAAEIVAMELCADLDDRIGEAGCPRPAPAVRIPERRP